MAEPVNYDLVIAYGGDAWVPPYAAKLASTLQKPLYVSDSPWDAVKDWESIPIELHANVVINTQANTTDQNARHSVLFMKQNGFKHALLVTSWDHAPRALFLTRLYMLGTGLSVESHPSEAAPVNWWIYRAAWIQLKKFWGSLGRVGLYAIGFETGPNNNRQIEKMILAVPTQNKLSAQKIHRE